MAGVLRLTLDSRSELDRPILPHRKTSVHLDVSPESVGQELCKERQRKGKMLMDVWRELKIPPHHLIAIEKGCYEALPGRVYAVGFVRSYAAYLGLDAESLVARLKAEMARPDVKLPVIGPSAPLEREDQLETARIDSSDAREPEIALLSPPDRRVPQFVIAGLMIVVIYSGYHFVASARQAAPPPVIPVPAQLAAEAGLTPKKIETPAVAAGEQPPPISHEPTLAPSPEVAPAQLAKAGPSPKKVEAPAVATVEQPARISHEPAPASSPEAVPPQPVSADARSAPTFHGPLPLGQRYGMQNRNSRVTLRVHRSIRVAVQGIRNRIFINRMLGAGDTYRLPNMAGLKLSVQDAGAIEVILDGNTVGFAGKDGVAARRLPLDPPSIISRYHWQQG